MTIWPFKKYCTVLLLGPEVATDEPPAPAESRQITPETLGSAWVSTVGCCYIVTCVKAQGEFSLNRKDSAFQKCVIVVSPKLGFRDTLLRG